MYHWSTLSDFKKFLEGISSTIHDIILDITWLYSQNINEVGEVGEV